MALFTKKNNSEEQSKSRSSSIKVNSQDEDSLEKTQIEQQWELFSSLYRQVPGNKWDNTVETALRDVLKGMQSNQFSKALYGAFPLEKRDDYKKQAEQEFASISRINRKRMESLNELSSKNMRLAVQESLYLFDVNYAEKPELELKEVVGYDDSGRPITEYYSFSVFPENSPHGIADRDSYLPLALKDGRTGMSSFITQNYPQLFEIKQEKVNSTHPIKAITTIGSLGGIGHKPDSDMDAQVIVETEPNYEYSWNDADFFIALILLVFQDVRKHFAEKILTHKELEQLKEQASSVLRTRFAESCNADELQIIHAIYPGTFAQERDDLLWKRIKKLKEDQISGIFWKVSSAILRELPDFHLYFKPFILFFPFFEKISAHEIQNKCFPLKDVLDNRGRLLLNLIQFYQHSILGANFSSNFLKKIAEQHGQAIINDPKKQHGFFLEHLKKSGNINRTLPLFLKSLTKASGNEGAKKLPETINILREELVSEHPLIQKTNQTNLIEEAHLHVRMNWSKLVEMRKDTEAQANEALYEFPLRSKVKEVEEYLTKKYPNTEVHYFLNIMRRMRKGQHTPFLVSPEGSLAYSLMLNDFLLNPATILGGLTPMPFDLPKDVRVLASIGVLPDEEWTFTEINSKGEEVNVPIRKMPDWGHLDIPRDLFHRHVIPIFLRESEKVSHRNLPKALLNCWWIEMLFLMDDPKLPLTSVTRLLWNPDQRHFIKNELNNSYTKIILEMENEFPHLVHDPWWLKFTEMLTRFKDKTIQDQIIFCFSQHINLADVIDFEGHGQTIFIDKQASWRMHSLVSFHHKFFNTPQKKELLMSFAQGHDDIANKYESLLKKLFLKSMNRVEGQLCHLAQKKAMKSVSSFVKQHAGKTFNPEETQNFLTPLMQQALQRVAIEDPGVLVKLRKKLPLTVLEKLQARNIYLDHQRLKSISEQIAEEYKPLNLNPANLESLVLHSRIPVAGDVQENVIFKYHFERNFKRKPFQIPLPISKTLSIPRSLIVLSFDPKRKNWKFCSMLSTTGIISARSASLEMFNAQMVQGIARCVFSGYIGYDSRHLTAFQKEASKIRSKISHNPLTHNDIQRLSNDIHEFFQSFKILPQELLENKHYIKEIYAVCNANQFLMISLIVRDNLGEYFVVDLDLSGIKLKSNLPIGEEHQPIGVFLDRLRGRKARELFNEALESLKIPIDSELPPRFGTWVNTQNFEIQVAQKYHSIYITGIVDLIWPSKGEYVPWNPNPAPLRDTLENLGKKSIDMHHKKMEEKQREQDLKLRKVQRDSREYMSRVEAERSAKEKRLME